MPNQLDLTKISENPLLVCNCAGSMDIDGAALAKALVRAEPLKVCSQLCRQELSVYTAALNAGVAPMVACTQEAPLFDEVANEAARQSGRFVNIRERAGWSAAGSGAMAKMAALFQVAAFVT